MEHPPKQGLKPLRWRVDCSSTLGFNGTSTKTRIETKLKAGDTFDFRLF